MSGADISSSDDPGARWKAVRSGIRSTADMAVSASISELRGRLVGLAVKLLWNRDDAEEVVQQAFEIAMKSGPATRESHFAPWMTRTVSNLCLNRRRRRR